ncbi:MAG: hypothetical protein LCI02_05005 [Proteobacteria bacterium]|nr:hypothetical protein [Pseudomonadota bacterium]
MPSCAAPGCARVVDSTRLMCWPHWRQVPRAVQQVVWRRWRAYLASTPATEAERWAAYMVARKAAVDSVTESSGQ